MCAVFQKEGSNLYLKHRYKSAIYSLRGCLVWIFPLGVLYTPHAWPTEELVYAFIKQPNKNILVCVVSKKSNRKFNNFNVRFGSGP